MQFGADWHTNYHPLEFLRDFGVELKGPGLYLTKTDTILVLANPAQGDVTKENIWNAEWPADTLWTAHVYNCPYSETVLSVLATAPTRVDER